MPRWKFGSCSSYEIKRSYPQHIGTKVLTQINSKHLATRKLLPIGSE